MTDQTSTDMTSDGAAMATQLHDRVEWNLTNHAPENQTAIPRFEAVREVGKDFSHLIIALCPDGRDRSLALTHVEDAVMRAVAAIARDQDGWFEASESSGGCDCGCGCDGPVEDLSECICPSGPEEDSYIPSAECSIHGAFFEEPVRGASGGVDELERAAREAIGDRVVLKSVPEDEGSEETD